MPVKIKIAGAKVQRISDMTKYFRCFLLCCRFHSTLYGALRKKITNFVFEMWRFYAFLPISLIYTQTNIQPKRQDVRRKRNPP